ncbi:class I SAM-dependent methyltransferase [Flavobacteriaceae bacterium]|nr:class I SAM-dependent methyltransferase [Flavobacteriaceae bacterium]
MKLTKVYSKLKYLKLFNPRYFISLVQRVSNLEKEVIKIEALKRDFDHFVLMPDKFWLEKCKEERMDALINDNAYMPQSRREFHLSRYKFASKYVKNKLVADVACGTGYGTRVLLEDGEALKCIGVDIDEKAILYARKKHCTRGSEFIHSSAENLPFKTESFDAIISFETLEHVIDDSKLINEFNRILKPNGLLIISTPNQWPLSIAKFHTKEYDLQEFQNILRTKFEIRKMYNQNSGDVKRKYNHMQPKGIVETTSENKSLAECFLAICEKKE